MRNSTEIEEENTALKYMSQLIYSPPHGFQEDFQFRNRRCIKEEVKHSLIETSPLCFFKICSAKNLILRKSHFLTFLYMKTQCHIRLVARKLV